MVKKLQESYLAYDEDDFDIEDRGGRDFEFGDTLYVVIKNDSTYAGVPCLTYEEARDLSSGHGGSHIYEIEKPIR